MYRQRILAAFIASTIIASFAHLAFSPLVTFAADSSALAKASYLPDELMQLPPQVTIVEDLSGYWAGNDAPLIRCIHLERPFESLGIDLFIPRTDFEPLEVAGGVTLMEHEQDVLLFYCLTAEGVWQRIGQFAYNWILGIKEVKTASISFGGSYIGALIGDGGNARSQRGVSCFVFYQLPDGKVAFKDTTPVIEKMHAVSIYNEYPGVSPVFAVYPTMETNWEIDLPFYHYANPDRYVLLTKDIDGKLRNVSSVYQGFYMGMLGWEGYLEIQQSAALGKPVVKPAEGESLLPLIIQTLIYYYDMGYPDEGLRLARAAARAYDYKEYKGQPVESIISETMARLKAQDKLIQDAIDKYNAEISAAAW